MSYELRYGIIKYNKKEDTFFIISSNRTMLYDSRVGFLDFKALSLKDELEREDINRLIAFMKPLMINATDRNVINHDNYIFYFNKLPKLSNIKIQNDVLTKEMIMGSGMKILSIIGGIISSGLIIISYIYPDTIPRNAGTVAMGASTMLSKARSGNTDQCNCDFINEEMGILNRKGGKFVNKLYINNEEFREEILNFDKDKKELDLDLILDKRCRTNTLNNLGNKYLAECITSKDNTKDLIEIMAKYYQ